ncbi:hypothetical protein AKJ37_07935 [candidate division MSBL1 archaeon SCGC-AAA259I09]|uniref:Antitoxin SocA-like Panacea domain-containing protein n=1 Tax=candidate division MSBL1 archaeon SCGC-AAA259I09 TaxID=1698267 RepID=A0A133UIW7_9EURY|nr:hypothetical protein AKJ37_07935 [candidate division MSBL1 archaeon SCGC-AAA259I09]
MDGEKAKVAVEKLFEMDNFQEEKKIQAVLYLAELETHRRYGEEFAGTQFHRKDGGPYSPELAQLIEETQKKANSRWKERGNTLLNRKETQVLEILGEGLGQLTTEEVLRRAKRTTPYLCAEEKAQIDFTTILTYPEREEALQKLFVRKGWKEKDSRKTKEPSIGVPCR